MIQLEKFFFLLRCSLSTLKTKVFLQPNQSSTNQRTFKSRNWFWIIYRFFLLWDEKSWKLNRSIETLMKSIASCKAVLWKWFQTARVSFAWPLTLFNSVLRAFNPFKALAGSCVITLQPSALWIIQIFDVINFHNSLIEFPCWSISDFKLNFMTCESCSLKNARSPSFSTEARIKLFATFFCWFSIDFSLWPQRVIGENWK